MLYIRLALLLLLAFGAWSIYDGRAKYEGSRSCFHLDLEKQKRIRIRGYISIAIAVAGFVYTFFVQKKVVALAANFSFSPNPYGLSL